MLKKRILSIVLALTMLMSTGRLRRSARKGRYARCLGRVRT